MGTTHRHGGQAGALLILQVLLLLESEDRPGDGGGGGGAGSSTPSPDWRLPSVPGRRWCLPTPPSSRTVQQTSNNSLHCPGAVSLHSTYLYNQTSSRDNNYRCFFINIRGK